MAKSQTTQDDDPTLLNSPTADPNAPAATTMPVAPRASAPVNAPTIDPTTGLPFPTAQAVQNTPSTPAPPPTDPNNVGLFNAPALNRGTMTPLTSTGSVAPPLKWTGAIDVPTMLAQAAQITKGRAPNADDIAYWQSVANRPGMDPDYLYQRMLGMQAGGADAAQAGPYSAANGYVYQGEQKPSMMLPLAQTAPTSIGGAPAASGPQDTSWMQGTPPGPGWVAVPGVGWLPPDNPAAQQYQASQPAAGSTPAAANAPASIDDQMRTAIMSLLQTPQNVTAQSLQTDPTVEAYNDSSQRAADKARAQATESAIQGGTYGSGALDTQKAGIDQQAAEGRSQFVGQVAMQKMQQNRDALAQGIQFAQSMGQFDKAQSLQLQLAQMDAAIRSAQVAQTGQLGQESLNLQGQQLSQNESQFLDSLGFNYTSLGQNANQAALLALLQSLGGG